MGEKQSVRVNLKWLYITGGVLFGGLLAFALFKPVRVVPRWADAPEYELEGLLGETVTQEAFADQFVLYAFGYTNDPTETLDNTIAEMERFYQTAMSAENPFDLRLALVLFDGQRDTLSQRGAFAQEQDLDLSYWSVLGGSDEATKYLIGYGFGVYYEAVPLNELIDGASADEDDYGYLQSQRYILVDGNNVMRAEYRHPMDMEIVARDVRLLVRELNSTGAARVVNETAHILMCYP